ncbi:MAG: hypothetical protein K5873_04020, partial [Treponema sp.]|nr:hypothetical protein [Treponema sp.]
IEGFPAGVYKLSLFFLSNDGSTLYSCNEAVTVFSGFTTDSWYGDSDYLITNDDGICNFTITESLLATYSNTNTVTYPIVLYDLNTDLLTEEFVNPKPGYAVFSSISGGESVADGIPFGSVKSIQDFTIDSAIQSKGEEQRIFTLEKDATGSATKILAYPTYAGYAAGSPLTVSNNLTDYESIYANENKIYILGKNSSDEYEPAIHNAATGENYTCSGIYDSDDTEKSLTYSYTFNEGKGLEAKDVIYRIRIAAETKDGNEYLYSLMYFSYKDGSTTYYFDCSKYKITYNEDEHTFTLTLLTSVSNTSENFTISNPSSLDLNDFTLMANSSGESCLYAIVSCVSNGISPCSRGGLILINNTEKDSDGVIDHVLTFNTENIAGWYYEGNCPDSSVENSYFFGAQKIIAKKPDEYVLVIADEGGYEDEDGYCNKNRAVTVDLKSFAITDVKDVSAGFGHYLWDNCGYGTYPGDETAS